MYKPFLNKVLVQIDDKDAKWGNSSADNIGGEVYREGKVLAIGLLVPTADYPISNMTSENKLKEDTVSATVGKYIMWHEGHEAGTVFEESGDKYALIYWWDVAGVKE